MSAEPAPPRDQLMNLAERLEETAAALREVDGSEGDAETAARLVDRCVELATEAGAELDRRARTAQETHSE